MVEGVAADGDSEVFENKAAEVSVAHGIANFALWAADVGGAWVGSVFDWLDCIDDAE